MAHGVFQTLAEDDPKTIGGYRLAARLGAGGMGNVYLSHTPGGRAVAIKVIRPEFAEDPEFRRRFAQEVRAAERVQGLYTAPVIDSDTDGAHPWLATAYVSGPTLAAAVAEHGAMPAATVLLLTAGVAEALQVVHGAGIVHRDLKPSNVLLAADGPRVIDFGIARAADTTALTGSGVTVGTPAFMSPEQAAGRTVGPRSDVFALGQVAAFAALGRSAHGDGPSHAVLYRIVHEEPDLAGLPAELTELVSRCLAKEPDERPTLAEVLALCNAASGATQLRRPEDWLPNAVTTVIADRYNAPQPLPATPAAVPAAPQHPPTAADQQPQQPSQPPRPAQQPSTQPQQPPVQPQYVPTQTAQPVQPVQPVQPHHAPTQTAHPVQPVQPVQHTPAPPWATGGHAPYGGPGAPGGPVGPGTTPGDRPARRRKTGLVVGAVVGVLVLAGAAVGVLKSGVLDGGGGSHKNGAATQPTGTKTSGTKPTRSAQSDDQNSGGQNTGDQNTGGQADASSGSTAAPTVYKNFNLADGYYLKFSDQPLVPHDSNYDDLYLSCDSDSCSFGSYNTKLVLLDQGEAGSLDACKQDTRYLPQEISLSRFSKGRQLCATTQDGIVALITYESQSPSSSASQYVTLDISIWRDAVPPVQD
ncbi:serine/threonine-protein kinase [Streptomyces sp. L2]|uniref:serine/threonine-protein kinase n=1 Tax=Streptomyces sp. L2 TaxID=2162665 RepID=UPI001F50B344|nr:serine/threonine-protein kinase [Streptomyces sp. L2]